MPVQKEGGGVSSQGEGQLGSVNPVESKGLSIACS